MYGAVDPSLGKAGKTRDPSAILIGGYNRHVGHLKLFEAAIKKRLPDKIIADMIYYQKKYNCVMWFVETKGIFNSIADFSPDLNFTSGVFNETFAGIHSLVVKPGISKYSPNVLDTSFK